MASRPRGVTNDCDVNQLPHLPAPYQICSSFPVTAHINFSPKIGLAGSLLLCVPTMCLQHSIGHREMWPQPSAAYSAQCRESQLCIPCTESGPGDVKAPLDTQQGDGGCSFGDVSHFCCAWKKKRKQLHCFSAGLDCRVGPSSVFGESLQYLVIQDQYCFFLTAHA